MSTDNTNTDKAPIIKNANERRLLYGDLTYRIRGAMFAVHTALGPGHKESLYQKALAREFKERDIPFIREKALPISYKDEKVVIEVKAVPFLAKNAEVQLSYYLRGTKYELGLLVNFGARRLDIRRRIYSLQR